MVFRSISPLRCLSLILLLSMAGLNPNPAQASQMRESPLNIQFTAGGHILVFDQESVHINGANHVLNITFIGTFGVTPNPVISSSTYTNLQVINRVTYESLWPGISLTYESTRDGIIKSTYNLEPGANPNRIGLHYNVPVQIGKDGDLRFSLQKGEMHETAPLAWQEINGQRKTVDAAFRLMGNHGIGFTLGKYDPAYPLVIDPTLQWNTFLGGTAKDTSAGIAVDGSGNVIVAGISDAAWTEVNPPVRTYTGLTDTFVAKLDSSGSLIWYTFLGGTGNDNATDITTDGSGNIYITGNCDATWGTPYRSWSGLKDGFVAKLDSNGVLQWNTFLGSSSNDESTGIAVANSTGNIYVAGKGNANWVETPVNPRAGWFDAYVAKLASAGTLVWYTFAGGTGTDEGSSIAIDGSENVFFSGRSSRSWGSPVRMYTPNKKDAFAARLRSNGKLVWNTFLGGPQDDSSQGIAVTTTGHVYVSGTSFGTWQGSNPPMRAFSGSSDAYIARLDSSGALQWNTFLGSVTTDYGGPIVLDGSEYIHASGQSQDSWGSPIRPKDNVIDVFTAKLDVSGNLQWNTFVGGYGYDYNPDIALDAGRNMFLTGYSDRTWGTPIIDYHGNFDVFATKISAQDITTTTITSDTPDPSIVGQTVKVSVTVTSDNLTPTGKVKITGADINCNLILFSDGTGYCSVKFNSLGTKILTATYLGDANHSGSSDTAVHKVVTLVKVTYRSLASQDGWIVESSETSGMGGTRNAIGMTLFIGDDAADRQYRSILSFNTFSLPDTAIITSIVIKVKSHGVIGINPFTIFQGLQVDISQPYFGTARSLEIGDFQASAGLDSVGTFSSIPSGGWYRVSLNASAHPFINLTGNTQFRLRFEIGDNDNESADYIKFFSGNYGTSTVRPLLIIQYYIP